MVDYTQERIDELVQCPKVVVSGPPRQMKNEDGHVRADVELASVDGQHRFVMFMRINSRYMENFTVGLRYMSGEDGFSPVLLRCNGPHGRHIMVGQPEHHRMAHVHRATPDNLSSGLRGERSAEGIGYTTYAEALRYFVSEIHLCPDDTAEYFAEVNQLPLWEDTPHAPSGSDTPTIP